MNLKLTGSALALCLFVVASSSQAQITGAVKDAPIVYGHHHLNVTSIPVAQKFFVDTLGGTAITVGGRQIVKFPNVFVFLREQKPTAGTKGSSLDHIGFSVPDLRKTVDKVRPATGWSRRKRRRRRRGWPPTISPRRPAATSASRS